MIVLNNVIKDLLKLDNMKQSKSWMVGARCTDLQAGKLCLLVEEGLVETQSSV